MRCKIKSFIQAISFFELIKEILKLFASLPWMSYFRHQSIINILTKTLFMKKILSAFAILAFFSVSFTACKKEKTKTAAEQIVGTWQISNILYNQHTNGADHIISTNDTANDTYEFTKDGTVNINLDGQSGSSTYTITDNKLTITDDETYDIKKLDDHNLVLYLKTVSGSDYDEVTVTFKR
jgi:hypothetical protein